MKFIPLFYYPTTIVWVDDDSFLLDTVTQIFSEHTPIKPFQSAIECLHFLNKHQSPLSKKYFLKSVTNDESYGVLTHSPTDFDITTLAKLADDPNRSLEISAMVIDFNMPEMDGFSLAKACNHLPIKKILLTGKADQNQAISGFNDNLIHRFIKKSDDDMENSVNKYLHELSIEHFQQITRPILSLLEAQHKLPVSDPTFVDFFNDYCKQKNICEYYLIDKQGSFLCINSQGTRTCLIVQSDYQLDQWLATYQSESSVATQAVQYRQKIPFFGIGKEAWQLDSQEWENHFYGPEILDGRERYYWATVNISK